jgi:hypothetical protein
MLLSKGNYFLKVGIKLFSFHNHILVYNNVGVNFQFEVFIISEKKNLGLINNLFGDLSQKLCHKRRVLLGKSSIEIRKEAGLNWNIIYDTFENPADKVYTTDNFSFAWGKNKLKACQAQQISFVYNFDAWWWCASELCERAHFKYGELESARCKKNIAACWCASAMGFSLFTPQRGSSFPFVLLLSHVTWSLARAGRNARAG